jgi:carboxymethylenebutenolidase
MELTTSKGEVFHNYIVGPEQATKAVLIIHDWWGMLDYNREWADEFAQSGYRALVVDLFNGHHPADVKKAGEYMRSLDPKVNKRKLQTALTALQAPNRKIAVLGWSFGGLQAQQIALQYPDMVNALVIFYCRIILDKYNAETLSCPVLALFSEIERTWPDKQVSLEQAMLEADKILECHSYDAAHGFANPDSPRYDNDAVEETRQVTVAFLDKHLA